MARKLNPELHEVLAEVNTHISAYAAEANLRDQSWEFICECGRPGCEERVSLPLPEYEALRSSGDPVLAEGHTFDRGAKARNWASRLIASTWAPRRRGTR